MYPNNKYGETKVVGNDYSSDKSLGFKSEVKEVFESYQQHGIDLANDLMRVIRNPQAKAEFIGNVMESITESPVFTSRDCSNMPFYNNYSERLEQLTENSLRTVAQESVLVGYAPIVAYNPFFLKKQWVKTVFKDVLMSEVPESPVINLAFEKRFLKDNAGKEYEIPDVFYDQEQMAKLVGEATGLPLKEDEITIAALSKGVNLLSPTYVQGMTLSTDPTAELTPDLTIFEVKFTYDTDKTAVVPCNIRVDVATHNFINGTVKYDVLDVDGHTVTKTLTDSITGTVDFKTGEVIVNSKGNVTAVKLRGKLANRFNQRSLGVERRIEHLQFVMPESGERINAAITVEEAADALVLQNIDLIADNVDVMGNTLAQMQDFGANSFLKKSFAAQEKANVGPHGFEKLTVSGQFNTLPYDSYAQNISTWVTDCREYIERIIEGLKSKLKTDQVAITIVSHPSNVRYLNSHISWIFQDNTQVSGMKLDYNVGVLTTSQDKVHIISSQYVTPDEGFRFIVIPLTKDLITYKHYFYNTVIDRGYRNPLYQLTPNVMCTQRHYTFEILPVQGHLDLKGRELVSPSTLRRE